MKAHDVFKMNNQMSNWMLSQYLKDMSDEDLLVRPAPNANHIAWQLGHIIVSNDVMMNGVKSGSAPKLPEGFKASYSKDQASVDEASKFHSKDTYIEIFGKQFEAASSLVDQISEADLDKPGPEDVRSYAPTIGAVFNIIGTHLILHIGQFTVVRRKLGKPLVF